MRFQKTIAILSVCLLAACFKKEEYPTTPALSYKDFKVQGDSATLYMDFTDGDGDIGLRDGDTSSPYNYTSGYYYNFNIEYYEKDDALGWVPGKDFNGDSIVFHYRIHPFTDLSKSNPLKGVLETLIEPIYYNNLSSQSDTIRYRVQLIDRALHKSAWVTTNTIIR